MKQFYHCGLYQYQLKIVGTTTKNGMVSLDCNMVGVSSALSSHVRIRGKNTTAHSQNTVARRSDFEMLLTNGLERKLQQWKGPLDKPKGPMG